MKKKNRTKKKNSVDKQLVESAESPSIFSTYLREVAKNPLLKHDDSVELFKRYVEHGDTAAKKKLIESNLRLVISIAKSYRKSGLPFEDLVQEGNLGLMKSVDKYDYKLGYRFSTYATWWIRQSIGQHVMKRKRTIRIPAHAQGINKKIVDATKAYRKLFQSSPTVDELVELVGASEKIIRATLESRKKMLSLSDPSYTSKSTGPVQTIEETVADEALDSNPHAVALDKELIKITREVLSELSPKEEAIIRIRFGLIEDPTNHSEYPITADEISSLESGQTLV